MKRKKKIKNDYLLFFVGFFKSKLDDLELISTLSGSVLG